MIHKKSEYCAVKFTEFGTSGNLRKGKYSNYLSYYQGDGTGDFSKPNVEIRKGKVCTKDPIIWRFRGGEPNFRCGPMQLGWSGEPGSALVYFQQFGVPRIDYEIEIAPTKWSDIGDVDIFDPRLKWYRYDEKRESMSVPLEELWPNDERSNEK